MGVLHVGVLFGWWLWLLSVGGGVVCRGGVGMVVWVVVGSIGGGVAGMCVCGDGGMMWFSRLSVGDPTHC